MNKLDLDYQNLLRDILENGTTKMDRTGTGTKSVFGRTIRHSMKDGFPLLTTKKVAFKTMVTELLWFLKGRTDLKYLLENGCHIWTGDAVKNYEKHNGEIQCGPHITKQEYFENLILTDDEFAERWGDFGPIYGAAWRRWKFTDKFTNGEQIAYVNGKVDQIQNLINELKTNPDSRRLLVSAWNVGVLPSMTLPPCHYAFQVYTRELSLNERGELFTKTYPNKSFDDFASGGMEVQSLKHQLETSYNNANIPKRAISLMWVQRSCDFPLGIPANIMSYSLLLMMIGKQVNMVPDELIGNLGDCHIYLNQIDGVKEQLTREPYQLPTLTISDRKVNDISEYTLDDIVLENYKSHPKIYFPLSN
jgi:thymidylate synthase